MAAATRSMRRAAVATRRYASERGCPVKPGVSKLVSDMAAGRVVPKVYRQFKMYNDPQYRRPGAEKG